jgi:hypothetical protein
MEKKFLAVLTIPGIQHLRQVIQQGMDKSFIKEERERSEK